MLLHMIFSENRFALFGIMRVARERAAGEANSPAAMR
jgi:hypothetical protein